MTPPYLREQAQWAHSDADHSIDSLPIYVKDD